MDAANAKDDEWKAQAAADEASIDRLLNQQANEGGFGDIDFSDNKPIDQSGKADDAEDFADISDDDLPDEEEATSGNSHEVPGLTDDGGTSIDQEDLFGDHQMSSPPENDLGPPSPAPRVHDSDNAEPSFRTQEGDTSFRDGGYDPLTSFHDAMNQDPDIPPPAETVQDLLKQAFPAFQPGKRLVWNELFPPKKARWIEKAPSRKPKPLILSKLSLDIAPDQEKAFRIPAPAEITRKQAIIDAESKGLVDCLGPDNADEDDQRDLVLDNDADQEPVAGFTIQDIGMAVDDWEAWIARADGVEEVVESNQQARPSEEDEWDQMFLDDDADDKALAKPKKERIIPTGLPEIPRMEAPSFEDFEEMTKHLGKRVRLDLNDPHLLLDDGEADRPTKRPRLEQKLKRMVNGSLGLDISQRFNLSNDEAYEALKENHQHKVRATLGNLAVEHSMPALRLTWPYYKVKLLGKADHYHRPEFRVRKWVGQTLRFDPSLQHKKKAKKGKPQEVYLSTADLSLNDNAGAVLFEYCERIPPVLSNFGMGNRVLNYHRKKSATEDDPIEKKEIGETQVLLPEDKSPFSIFGEVQPGETMPTLHNQMYRAPIFRHEARGTDFILSRSTTGVGGPKYHLHAIDHLYVVGQTFPSQEVPGPHSRKVTNASKNRIKMISFRMMRRHPLNLLNLGDVTKHISDSTDAQNRQKLKEFLAYGKVEKGLWNMREGETLMDESQIRRMIKPEDTALIDAMQLGMKLLEDAGFDPRNAVIEDDNQMGDAEADEDDDEDGERPAKQAKKLADKGEETLADKMAPWKTSKAFIDACAGKAMLQLHGEGDPTGHGLGFSFIRTSMKGGYIEAVQGPMATSADAMEREKRANGGHAYNVKKQDQMYKAGIAEIWEKQKKSLSDGTLHDDNDVLHTADEDERFNHHSAATPAHIDDGTSQISGRTSASRQPSRRIRIIRRTTHANGHVQEISEIVEDPVVITHYIKRRNEADAEARDVYQIRPTGDANLDRHEALRIQKEIDRLEKNRARRHAREQQKGLHRTGSVVGGVTPASAGGAGSPEPSGPGPIAAAAVTGTTRKCANCGQVGHIKTNKKLCPLLNGTMKADSSLTDGGGFGNFNAGSPG